MIKLAACCEYTSLGRLARVSGLWGGFFKHEPALCFGSHGMFRSASHRSKTIFLHHPRSARHVTLSESECFSGKSLPLV